MQCNRAILSITAPLILKVREIIFFAGKMGPFERFFEGAETFLCQKGQGPLEKSQEMPNYVFCPRPKNNITHFQNQMYIGIFMSLYMYIRDREGERGGREIERERERNREHKRGWG